MKLTRLLFKDEVLDRVAAEANVAQFVSFGPNLEERFSRLIGHAPNQAFGSVEAAIAALLAVSPEGGVGVRSYEPTSTESRPFFYGLRSVDEAAAAVRRLAADGLYTIVGETVDIFDGGVSGVVLVGQVGVTSHFGDVLRRLGVPSRIEREAA